MCVQEYIEHSSMSQRPRLSQTKTSDVSLATKIKQQKLQTNYQGLQKAGILFPRGGIYHFMSPHGYVPHLSLMISNETEVCKHRASTVSYIGEDGLKS